MLLCPPCFGCSRCQCAEVCRSAAKELHCACGCSVQGLLKLCLNEYIGSMRCHADGTVYLRDVCLTLAAFLGAAPAAAPTLLGDGGAALAALAPLHDEHAPRPRKSRPAPEAPCGTG